MRDVDSMLNFIDFDIKVPAYNNLIQWTESALECYERGCNCQNCDIPKPSDKCCMKTFVLLLVKTLGNPQQALTEKLKREKLETEIVNIAQTYLEKGVKKGWKKFLASQYNISYDRVIYILRKHNLESYTYMRNKQ